MSLDAKVVHGKNQELVAALIEKNGSVRRQLVQIVQNEKNDFKPMDEKTIIVPLVIQKKYSKALVRL